MRCPYLVDLTVERILTCGCEQHHKDEIIIIHRAIINQILKITVILFAISKLDYIKIICLNALNDNV